MLLVAMVLMNLLIGLAVSDIQGLQTEGRIKRLRKQAQFVVFLEDVALCGMIGSLIRPKIATRLKNLIDQAPLLVLHPAVNKPKTNISCRTIERALRVAQEGQAPVDRVNINDVYHSIQEYAASVKDLAGRMGSLERYVGGHHSTTLDDDTRRRRTQSKNEEAVERKGAQELADHLTISDDEFDQVDAGTKREDRSLRSDIDQIKKMLTSLMTTPSQ